MSGGVRPPLSLEELVAPRVRPEAHPKGPAVRVADRKRAILFIAFREDERDAFLSAVQLRVAPWHLLREIMEAEMRDPSVRSVAKLSLADAARGFINGTDRAAGASTSSAAGGGESGTVNLAERMWEKAGTVAEVAIWGATFGQGIGGVARGADGVEALAKPLSGLTCVGCAFSLVALSARAVRLMAMEHEGKDKLLEAQNDLRKASVSLVSWLFNILGLGFNDEDKLVEQVFEVLGECWDVADALERYLLRNWVTRAWNADDVSVIVGKVNDVNGRLLAAGLFKVVATLENRMDALDIKAFEADIFRPYAPEPFELTVGLVENAAKSLLQLKAAVLSGEYGEGSTAASSTTGTRSSSTIGPVALSSIYGEGGVGKTSTCKLLCADEDVRAQFVEGAILWINVGKGASEEDVVHEVRKAVSKCGGKRAAREIGSSSDISEAVDIACYFFKNNRILVIVDDVWETTGRLNASAPSLSVALSKIARFPGSATIVTTRSSLLSNTAGFHSVPVARLSLASENGPDWGIAEHLYDALLNAAQEKRVTDIYVKDRKRVLELTCGLPLGIKTFVRLVRSRLDFGHDVSSVLSKIERRAIGLADKFIGEDMKDSIGHPGLFAAMGESLAFLDEHKSCRVDSTPLTERKGADGENCRVFTASYAGFTGSALSSRYAALEIMELPMTRKRLSFHILCRLWHLRNVDEVEEVARLYANIGLGWIETHKDSLSKWFCLHDLQYNFCIRLRDSFRGAAGSCFPGALRAGVAGRETLSGHALLLSSCESMLENINGDVGNSVPIAIAEGWRKFCFATDIAFPVSMLHEDVECNLVIGRNVCFATDIAFTESILREYLARNLVNHVNTVAVHYIVTAGEHEQVDEDTMTEIARTISITFSLCQRSQVDIQAGRPPSPGMVIRHVESNLLSVSPYTRLDGTQGVIMHGLDTLKEFMARKKEHEGSFER